MPVAANDRDVRSSLLVRRYSRRPLQAHRAADTNNGVRRGPYGPGDTYCRHELPVSPYEGMKSVRKVGDGDRRRGAARGKAGLGEQYRKEGREEHTGRFFIGAAASSYLVVSGPIFTTSKSLPRTSLRAFSSSTFQRGSGAPVTNQLPPLSASIIP